MDFVHDETTPRQSVNPWVGYQSIVDIDMKGFFDMVDHVLLLVNTLSEDKMHSNHVPDPSLAKYPYRVKG